jgi:hypothetical protein
MARAALYSSVRCVLLESGEIVYRQETLMSLRRRLERFVSTPPSPDDCPSPDDLAAYIFGRLEGAAQLSTAAHVRGCPLCQLDIALTTPPADARAPRLRVVTAMLRPLGLAAVRSSDADADSFHYVAGDLTVSLSTVQRSSSSWQLTGRVLSGGLGLPGWMVTVSVPGRRHRQVSDEDGLFTVAQLPAGRCVISLHDGTTRVRISDLVLGHADETP